ncbi:hypothetical protein BAUCODRAFT_382522 [Baudoinia panamericana UAMH 10762]|uniref:Uncharacterized protein n=1 Tax=Baudoinia panamericana (strain UAMH 10762) TaxID=717646 RepID=M2NHM2_BAUPA|nr:uncharacterized protein BAUCODRAFT_382522 [Baudoinia panamericana UAMH 10762]EMC98854.1 hypothetical protein BAUCODRAFT_382522 [Baudoinia panamericana UAMH 10762]
MRAFLETVGNRSITVTRRIACLPVSRLQSCLGYAHMEMLKEAEGGMVSASGFHAEAVDEQLCSLAEFWIVRRCNALASRWSDACVHVLGRSTSKRVHPRHLRCDCPG